MFCTRCGNQVPDDAIYCNRCAHRLVKLPPLPQVQAVPQAQPQFQVQPQVQAVPQAQIQPQARSKSRKRSADRTEEEEQVFNWLFPAVLVTVLCFLPFGIVSIVFAAKANTLAECGFIDEAKAAAAAAKMWHWLALGVSVPIYVAALFLWILNL